MMIFLKMFYVSFYIMVLQKESLSQMKEYKKNGILGH